jgi:hypothetical protein
VKCYSLNMKCPPQLMYFVFLNILLIYNSCTGDFLETFPYIHILYSGLVHPFHYSTSSLTPFLKMTQQVSVFHTHACVENTHYPLLSSFTLPFLLAPSPTHDLFYIPILHCLSVCSLFSFFFFAVLELEVRA